MPLRQIHPHEITKEVRNRATIQNWVLGLILVVLILIFLEGHGLAQGIKPTGQNVQQVSCVSGCSSTSGPFFGSTFPLTGIALGAKNGGLFVNLAADASNNLNINCAVGCSASAGFLDNATFAPGTTPVSPTGGWYSTSPTNCTSGSACVPQLTIDRKLYVQAFQGGTWNVAQSGVWNVGQSGTWSVTVTQATGSNLHVVCDSGCFQTTQPVSGTVTANQGTSPWVNSITTWGGGTLGAMANYGTSPGAVLVPGVNAFITNTPAVSQSGTWNVGQSGSWTVSGTGNFTVTQATGTNLHMVCDSGCSSSAGFADNSAFTVGTTAINVLGGLYDTGADPTITNGSAARARVDSHSYLFVDCFTGCFQATQPISAASLPLPTGAAQDSSLTTIDTDLKANVTLHAGANIVGKVGIDQTTPGTTNGVQVNNFPGTQPVSCATAATCPVNASQVGGPWTTTDAADGSTGSAVPSKGIYVGGNGSGNLTGIISCDNSAAVSMSTATTTQIVAISGTAGRTYICSINLVAAAADNVALISGSGTNCASNVAGLAGGTTAATGWNFAANGGLTQGSGLGMIYKTVTTNNEICLVTSAATQLSGTITYTQF